MPAWIPITAFCALYAVVAQLIPDLLPGVRPTWARVLQRTGAIAMSAGAMLLLTIFFSASGGLADRPGLEWPIGTTNDAVVISDGDRRFTVVPHSPSGRIQVYDENLDFVRGWGVPAGGGSFAVVPTEVPPIFVITARGPDGSDQGLAMTYTLEGSLLNSVVDPSEAIYGVPPGVRVDLPIRWWQRPLTTPLFGFVLIGLGLFVILGSAGRYPGGKVTSWRDLKAPWATGSSGAR